MRSRDPAFQALRQQHQHRLEGGGKAGSASQPLGWVADLAAERERVNAWIAVVDSLHQGEARAARQEQPDLDSLMQAWSPAEEQQLKSSPLPDPNQDVDATTFARLVCNVMGLPTSGACLTTSLHTLFSLYLEFKHNPAFHGSGLFD